ncbi:DUF4105 domain-containing protein [Lysobacter soyae]|uniref:DUF4105 domain-containing protein n=1 Tax=Lysobacter soyae TaxID=2764185 RepID=A0ABX8WNU9_9GAMM|nr:DUF4105 domain-containing protein [Lysobacter sp. CJ11]QYR52566.1 DUF4105 domain-containing protein [Lysobacter sp. CJ11]
MRSFFLRLAVLFLMSACWCLSASAAPRVGVMTMAPGEIFWERFGHDSLVVVDDATGSATSYNFGYFDLAEPGFVKNFARGRMQYMLAAIPLQDDLANYREEGRGVKIQWLNLTDAQATLLAARLAENAKPENARYRYDYFRDNCTTRVRDALDGVLDGRIERQLSTTSNGDSFRSEALRLSTPTVWMWLGFDLGLGPEASKPLSFWDDAFLPEHLASGLDRVKLADGRPLVRSTETLLPHRLDNLDKTRRLNVFVMGLLGAAFGGLLYWLATAGHRKLLGALLGITWLKCGILGCVLLLGWLFTDHWAMWRNSNLLLFSPLALCLLPAAVCVYRGRAPGRFAAILSCVLALLAVLATFILWIFNPQPNGAWIALMLPILVAITVALHHLGSEASK